MSPSSRTTIDCIAGCWLTKRDARKSTCGLSASFDSATTRSTGWKRYPPRGTFNRRSNSPTPPVRNHLAAHDDAARDQFLTARPLGVDVVHELEIAFSQLQHRDISGRAGPKRSEPIERRDAACRIDRDGGDRAVEGHAEHQEFRDDGRKVEDAKRAPGSGDVRRDRVGPEPVAHGGVDNLPR